MPIKSTLSFFVLFLMSLAPQAGPRSITGTYRNSALGYSVSVPEGFTATDDTDEAAGPKRGLTIALPNGGKVSVYGEPNSLGWKTPSEGVKAALARDVCSRRDSVIFRRHLGTLPAAESRMRCGDRVLYLLLGFRPGGGPIYWLRLDTTAAHESEDARVFQALVSSFKLIPWH